MYFLNILYLMPSCKTLSDESRCSTKRILDRDLQGGFHIKEFLHLQKFAMAYFVLVWVNVMLIQARLLITPQIQ